MGIRHLVSLADPEQYGKGIQRVEYGCPSNDAKHWKLTVLRRHPNKFQIVKKLLLRNDIKDVIIATDAEEKRISCQMDLTDVWK